MNGGEKSEKRREKRKLVTVPVECRTPGEAENFSARGITVNVSPSGVSFYTHKKLEEGANILISGNDLWEGPRRGEVKWCTRIIGGLYRVGMLLG